MANWPDSPERGDQSVRVATRPVLSHPHPAPPHPSTYAPAFAAEHDFQRRAMNTGPEPRSGLMARFGRGLLRLSRYRRFFVAAAGLCLTFMLLILSIFAYFALTLPRPSLADLKHTSTSIQIVDANGRTLARKGERHKFLTTDQMPQHLINAVLATEDRRFFNHFGLDVIGLARATYRNIRAGRYVEGGSTITQQLAKNVFLKPQRTLSRKIQELILSFWLEVHLSKKQILELYLNRVYFGSGAYGIEAAANRYFGKPTQNLTLGESAVLAGLLKAPSRYSPQRDPSVTLRRARIVLQNMVRAGVITEDEVKAVTSKPLQFVTTRPRKRLRYANYAIDWIYDELARAVGKPTGNIVVRTTIDRGLQVRAQRLVQKHLGVDAHSRRADEAAIVLLDNNGGVKALVGGRSYQNSQFNRAVKARRQPGSAFKPFVYVAAIENGFTPDTVAYDEPITLKNWSPKNYGKKYSGPVTLRDALARSINTVAVRVFLEVGRTDVVNVAERLGIKSKLHTLPSLALGTAEVSPLELTSAYVPFSNGGFSSDTHVISSVTTIDGEVLYEQPKPSDDRVLHTDVVSAMNDMLATTLTSGTGRRAAFPPHPAAGKTGTTQDFRDAWFVGYTSHFTAGVWVGNDKAVSMEKVVGGGLPAVIWNDLMSNAHENIDPVPLPGSYADRVRRNGVQTAHVPEPEQARNGSAKLADARSTLSEANKKAPDASTRRSKTNRQKPDPWSSRWSHIFNRN